MENNDYGQKNGTNNENSAENLSNQTVFSTEKSNPPLPCPRCGMVGVESFCKQCGLDLVAYYQAQSQFNQFPQQNSNFQNQQYFYNGVPQYVQYPNQYARPKPRVASIISIILLISLAVLLAVSIPFVVVNSMNNQKPQPSIIDRYNDPLVNSSKEPYRNGVSLSEYDELKLGLSYAHVSAIIGCDGVLSDSGRSPKGIDYYTYTWHGDPDTEALIHITFENDVVSSIMEVGLLDK